MGLETLAAALAVGASTAEVAGGVAVAGAYLGAAGTATSMYGSYAQHEASVKAEGLRERQMQLQNQREQREIIRRAQVAQATSLTNTSSAGTGYQGSSALPGAFGQIQGHENQQILASEQNLAIGEGLFKTNVQEADAKMISGIGTGASNLGGALLNRSMEVGRLFGDANPSGSGKSGSNPFVGG